MKKQYIVPSTCEAELLMESMILSESGGGSFIPVGPGDPFYNPDELA